MFEKEAKKWVKEHTEIEYKASYGEFPKEPSAMESFKAGAEFGYKLAHEEMDYLNKHWRNEKDKANEWHDLRKNPDDLPKDCKGKLYLVDIYSDSRLKFEYATYTPTVCFWNSEWKRFEILELTVGSRIVNINDVIAWKEIVLPELKETK